MRLRNILKQRASRIPLLRLVAAGGICFAGILSAQASTASNAGERLSALREQMGSLDRRLADLKIREMNLYHEIPDAQEAALEQSVEFRSKDEELAAMREEAEALKQRIEDAVAGAEELQPHVHKIELYLNQIERLTEEVAQADAVLVVSENIKSEPDPDEVKRLTAKTDQLIERIRILRRKLADERKAYESKRLALMKSDRRVKKLWSEYIEKKHLIDHRIRMHRAASGAGDVKAQKLAELQRVQAEKADISKRLNLMKLQEEQLANEAEIEKVVKKQEVEQ